MAAFPAGEHCGHRRTGKLKEATEIHSGGRVIVIVGVLGERLGNEDAGIVDNHVNPSEPLQRGINDALADATLRDIAGNREHHGVVRLNHRSQIRGATGLG